VARFSLLGDFWETRVPVSSLLFCSEQCQALDPASDVVLDPFQRRVDFATLRAEERPSARRRFAAKLLGKLRYHLLPELLGIRGSGAGRPEIQV